MMTYPRINDVFNFMASDGIFNYINMLNVPWKDDDIINSLNIDYHGGRSGSKYVSPLVNAMIIDGELSITNKRAIAKSIVDVCGRRWSELWLTMNYEYNPIENYSMVEKHTGNDKLTDTPNSWRTSTTETPSNWKEIQTQTPNDWKEIQTQTPNDWKETQTQTPTDWKETQTQTPTDWKETQTQTPTNWKEETQSDLADNETTTKTGVYGFNSTSAVNDTTATTSNKSKATTTKSGTYKTDTERTGTFETETERTGTFETETERTGTFETATERTGTFKTETSKTGTFETETERTGTFKTETEQAGTFETETERTGTFRTDVDQTGTYEHTTQYNSTLVRTGNVGTLTSQQMIESQRALWLWDYFRMVVYPDIDQMLTLSIY